MTLIKVTQEDIDNGVRKSSSCCPIARAVNRQMKSDDAYVCGSILSWSRKFNVDTPEIARKFIGDFDDGVPVVPFEFELDIVTVEN